MDIKKNKFLNLTIAISIGLTGLFIVDKLINQVTPEEAAQLYSDVQKKEELQNVNVSYTQKDLIESFQHTNFKENKHEVNIGFFTTNILKACAPIDYFKAKTKAIAELIVLHETSHAIYEEQFMNSKNVVNFSFINSNISKEGKEKLNTMLNNFNLNARNKLSGRFMHENFADTYGSMLLIRNSNFSEEEIRQAITARYSQVKMQKNFLWGATGDLEHRTADSLEQVLSLDFKIIKSLSPEQVKDLALDISSKSAIIELRQIYNNLAKNSEIVKNVGVQDSQNFEQYVSQMTVSEAMNETRNKVGQFNINNLNKQRILVEKQNNNKKINKV